MLNKFPPIPTQWEPLEAFESKQHLICFSDVDMMFMIENGCYHDQPVVYKYI